MASFFLDLDNKSLFLAKIGAYYDQAPKLISSVISCDIVSRDNGLEQAFDNYKKNINFFSGTVRSGNPDHCKRAAALLKALYTSKIIEQLSFPVDIDELDGGFSPVSFRHSDISYALPYIRLYNQYYNEMFSFSISQHIWGMYEQNYKNCNIDYIKNMCAYLKQNNDVSLDDLFMIFKSLSQ